MFPSTKVFTETGIFPFEKIPQQGLYFTRLNDNTKDSYTLLYTFLHCALKDAYHNEELRSLSYRGMNKGEPSGTFGNAMMLKLQYQGEPQQLKYFCSKKGECSLLMCDLPSRDEAQELAKTICTLFNAALARMRTINASIAELREPLNWLVNNSLGGEYLQRVQFKIRKDRRLGNMCFCTEITKRQVKLPLKVPEVYAPGIQTFLALSSDLTRTDRPVPYDRLIERVAVMLNDSNSPVHNFRPVETRHVSIICRYDLGGDLNRYELNQELLARGYDSRFVNAGGVSVMVHMRPSLPYDRNSIHRKDDRAIDKFTFNPSGIVFHHGTLPHLMKANYEKLFSDIWSFREKIYLSQNLAIAKDSKDIPQEEDLSSKDPLSTETEDFSESEDAFL